MHGSYPRFFLMVATSAVIMYGLMYLNTYTADHVFWSETRLYMACIMGATMAIVMLAFMRHMYTNKGANIAILATSAAVFLGALALVRSQATIDDVAWMKAMIPHHSIAILTSERARITDPRARQLAEQIIRTQQEEIAEMKSLIRDLEQRSGG
jgi:uncharacterized protein (DUF305 family)